MKASSIDQKNYANDHIAWLVCLYGALTKMRREGTMSVEGDVEMPAHEASLFHRFPQTLKQPYLEFSCDVLRQMVGMNFQAGNVHVYADNYITGLMSSGKGVFRTGVDESLLRTIWLTLWASINDYAPPTAVEFGRQAIPVKLKPTFDELEGLLKQSLGKQSIDDQSWLEGGRDEAVDDFIASMADGRS